LDHNQVARKYQSIGLILLFIVGGGGGGRSESEVRERGAAGSFQACLLYSVCDELWCGLIG
jgi:hypothetical protein